MLTETLQSASGVISNHWLNHAVTVTNNLQISKVDSFSPHYETSMKEESNIFAESTANIQSALSK